MLKFNFSGIVCHAWSTHGDVLLRNISSASYTI